MLNGVLHVFGERVEQHPLTFPENASLGAAELADMASWVQSHPDYPFGAPSCASVLRYLRQVQIAYRYCLFAPDTRVGEILNQLQDHAEQTSAVFTAAVAVADCTQAASGASESGQMLLLDQRQFGFVRNGGGLSDWRIPTGQIVQAPSASQPGERPGDSKPYLVSDLASDKLLLGEDYWQLYPVNEMPAEVYEREAAYTCYLHPDYKSTFHRRWLLFENEELQRLHFGLALQLASNPVFTRHVPHGRVGLHESLAKGLGVRPGEPVKIRSTTVRLPLFERRVFRYRHAVCRVTFAGAVDVGHPVARLRPALLEVLGLNPGQEIVITALAEGTEIRRHLKRIRVRALEAITDDTDSIEVSNVQTVIGVEDIEPIALDLLRRQAVAVSPGSPVIIRPALLSLSSQEVVPVSLAFTTAIIGSVAASNLTLVIIVAVVFTGFIVALILRKFR